MRIGKQLLVVSMMFVLTTSGFSEAQADSNELPYSVQIVYPPNQVSGVTGYFDLHVKPLQQQTIQIKLTNKQSTPLEIQVKALNAFTHPSGGMMYSTSTGTDSYSLLDNRYLLASHITVPSKITLNPNEQVVVPIKVSVPNLDTGTVLGGVQFLTPGKRETQTNQTQQGQSNFVLQYQLAFSEAIELELPKPAASSFSFGDVGFVPENGKMFLEMKNDAPIVQRQISATYSVLDRGGKKLFDGNISPTAMAPESRVQYLLPWDASTVSPGTYMLQVNGSVGGKPIQYTKSFGIKNQQVVDYQKHVNPEGVPGTPIRSWVYVLAGIVIAALIGTLANMVRRGKKSGGKHRKRRTSD